MVHFLFQQDVKLEDSIPLSKGISPVYQKQSGLWGISNHIGSKDTNTNTVQIQYGDTNNLFKIII